MNNLLCDFMPYGKFNLSDLDQAINSALDKAKQTLNNVVANVISSWEDTITPLHECIYKLNYLWGCLNHLMSVADNTEIRDLYNKLQPPITNFFVNLGQNKALYNHYKNIKQNNYSQLTIEQQKVLDNEFRDFYLSGISLSYDKQQQLKKTQNSLEQASTIFAQNVLDATDNFVKYVTQSELPGVPHDILSMLKNEALKDEKQDLYKLTLHMPSYLPIMQYCENRKLRQEMYREYVIRASELSSQELDNSDLIIDILNLRQEKANILGFNHYSELSLYTKMADNYQQVLDFLYELAKKSKPYATTDLAELRQFASSQFGINNLEAWDIAFFSEKLQQEKYNYSTQELKQYFQLPNVIDGLFKLIYSLYQIKFQQVFDIPTWHTDVQVFAVTNMQNNVIGHLFLDLYSRTSKAQGAWMHSAQDKYKTDTQSYNPIAYVICNFTNPIGKENSLLTFDEVQTLFHEMGHALHHLLTKISSYTISGINGVEWDAVELPSQFMEYFAWDYNILLTITKHTTSGEVLPKTLYNKLLKARYFQAGLQMQRQLEFAIYDLLLHSTNNVQNINYISLLDKVRSEVAVINPPKYNRFPHSFTHIFAGGYASGYYSYKWAEVLATDIFSLFENVAMDKLSILGNKFAESILSKGGLNPMMDNFKAFMGREPNVDSLIKFTFGVS